MLYSIHKHLTFNTWANTQTANVLKEVDDEIYFRENKSSFPSIAKTILHMHGAQAVWLKRLQGESLTAFPAAEFERDKIKTLDLFIKYSKDLENFIASKDDAYLVSEYSYRNMKGDPFTDPVIDTLFHVVNHGTYHRGQVITMLREAGVTKVVGTDLIHYLRSLKK
ncbi:MAG TPA: DinB family protein [Ohtaekwangia sp.]